MAIGLITNMDNSRREDILDVIQDVTPRSTPLMTLLKTSKAQNTIHQWVEDYQARASTTATTAEGSDFTNVDLTQPAKRTNVTAIVTKAIQVSDTEREVNIVGGQDPFTYQKGKGLVGWKLQAEYNLINGALVSGVSGTGAQMAGLDSVITSHATARLSGTSISVQEINDVVGEVFNDVGMENMFDLLIVPMALKQKVGTLSTNLTRYEDASSGKLNFPVQVWESDGGPIRILPHQDVRRTAGSVTIYGIKEDRYRVAYLRTPSFKEMGKAGDHTRGQWVGELTLEFLAERSGFKRTGYNTAG
jgi:hypothetical protein